MILVPLLPMERRPPHDATTGNPVRCDASIEPCGDRVLVELRGEVDISAMAVVASLEQRVLSSPLRVVALDLRQVDFCDWQGLRALVQLARRLGDHGRAVAIRSWPPSVWRLLAVLPPAVARAIGAHLVEPDEDGRVHVGYRRLDELESVFVDG